VQSNGYAPTNIDESISTRFNIHNPLADLRSELDKEFEVFDKEFGNFASQIFPLASLFTMMNHFPTFESNQRYQQGNRQEGQRVYPQE
jgi:hypothetical protein